MAEEVHVGEGGRKSKLPRWQFVVVLVVVLVAAVGAGGMARWLTTKNSAAIKENPLPVAVDDAQNLRLNGKSSEAEKLIDEALANSATSSSEKYMLYIQQGNLHFDAGKYTEALVSYNKAAEVKSTYEIAVLLGDTYVAAGDKAQAIEWYKKALPLVQKEDNPLYQDDIDTVKNKITELGGQP